MLSIWGK